MQPSPNVKYTSLMHSGSAQLRGSVGLAGWLQGRMRASVLRSRTTLSISRSSETGSYFVGLFSVSLLRYANDRGN